MEPNFLKAQDIRIRVNSCFEEKLSHITREEAFSCFSDEDTVKIIQYWLFCQKMGILTQEAVDIMDKVCLHKFGYTLDTLEDLAFRSACVRNYHKHEKLTDTEEAAVLEWHKFYYHKEAVKNDNPYDNPYIK